MTGRRNPKTGQERTTNHKKIMSNVQCHNLLHNSDVDRGKLTGLSLPEGRTSLNQCTVAEMKEIILARD